jgi:hypothetical protein
MKYIKAKQKKLKRIQDFVQHEVDIGKCDQQDIDDIVNHLRVWLVPKVQTITNEESNYLYAAHYGTQDPTSLVWTPTQISEQIDLQIQRLREDPF